MSNKIKLKEKKYLMSWTNGEVSTQKPSLTPYQNNKQY